MYNFLVLGFIPGTDIQLDFTEWLLIATSAVLLVFLAALAVRLFRTRKTQLATVETTGKALDATQIVQQAL